MSDTTGADPRPLDEGGPRGRAPARAGARCSAPGDPRLPPQARPAPDRARAHRADGRLAHHDPRGPAPARGRGPGDDDSPEGRDRRRPLRPGGRGLYEVRATLEALAGRRFVRHASAEQVKQLRREFRKIERIAKRPDHEIPELLAAKDAFYDVLFEGAGNSAIRETLGGLRARVRFLRATSLSQPNRSAGTIKEIRDIVRAAEARDADAMAAACGIMCGRRRAAAGRCGDRPERPPGVPGVDRRLSLSALAQTLPSNRHARGRHDRLRRQADAPRARGSRPGRDPHPTPPPCARSLAGAPRRQGRDRDPHPRQAPVPGLRGRSDDPLASADDGIVDHVRARTAVAALAAAGVADPRARRPPGGGVRRPAARAADRQPDALDQRLAAPRPPTFSPTPSTPSASSLRLPAPDDPTRGIGDALLDQRNVAGIGNLWKSESCWDAAVDPWRRVGDVSDAEAISLIDAARPRMFKSARTGRQDEARQVFRRHGEPCARCGTTIRARGQGDDNRTTFWCPGCQR